MAPIPLRQRRSFQRLEAHYDDIKDLQLRDLFAGDPGRGERFVADAAGLYLDYSKNRVTTETMGLLADLARESALEERRDAMFDGKHINVSENRAVLHIALRMPRGSSLVVDGVDVVQEVHQVLDAMTAFSDRVRAGEWKGHTGKSIRNVVNIGIGGSDLGPVMAYEALRHYSRRDMTFRFISNVDSTDFAEATADLSAEETLFIVSSKTFGTLETLTNATSARNWVVDQLGAEAAVAKHFVAVSTKFRARRRFRYRHRQHVRLLGLGRWALLDGLRHRALDHAGGGSRTLPRAPRRVPRDGQAPSETPLETNLPVLMGMLAVWYGNFFGAQSSGVMPYDQYLKRFPAYLQQPPWSRTASTSRSKGGPSTTRRGPSTGVSPAPTASTASTSSSTRGRS